MKITLAAAAFASSLLLTVTACAGSSAGEGEGEGAAEGEGEGAGEGEGEGEVSGDVTLAASATSGTEDRVSPSNAGTTTDTHVDLSWTATIVGPAKALYLVIVDDNGDIAAIGPGASTVQWDTDGATATTPTGSTYLGSQTWVLGVYDGVTLLNDNAGAVTLDDSTHTLTLFGSDPRDQATYDFSTSFAQLVVVRPDDTIERSPAVDVE